MKNTGSFKLIIPLERATDVRNCGVKAATIARLMKAGFATPDGFCLSADAYRAHLWAAGIRTLARGKPDVSDREALRKAILESELPADVLSALESAYNEIEKDALVAVRHSASDESLAGKAYITSLGVKGFQPLIEAIKECWASLWSDEAVALRERHPGSTEPSMAVIIQTVVDSRISGVAVPINPTTGNPNEVHIRSTWGVYTDFAPTDRAVVDLLDFSVRETTVVSKETILRATADGIKSEDAPPEQVKTSSISKSEIVEVAEAAIWVDTALGSPWITQWVYKGDQLLVLGAWSAGKVRQFFPVSWKNKKEGLHVWQLLSSEPSLNLMRGFSVFHKRRVPSLPSFRKKPSLRIQNGRPYRRVIHPWESKRRIAVCFDLMAGAGLHKQWKRASDKIVKSCWKDLSKPVQKLATPKLIKFTFKAAKRTDLSAQWMEVMIHSNERFPRLLQEMLSSLGVEPMVFPQLLMGCSPTQFERDREFQRLATYIWQASEDNETADVPHQISAEIAKGFGYIFNNEKETFEPEKWKSWIEDSDQIIKIAESLTQGQIIDVDLAQTNALLKTKAAEERVIEVINKTGNILKRRSLRRRFRLLLKRARTAVAAAGASKQVYALALSTLRIGLLEIGRRLVDSDILFTADDIFHLPLKEIKRLRFDLDSTERESLKRLIAERKHRMWLERRLISPQWLPLGAGPSIAEPTTSTGRMFTGKPVCAGEAIGEARVVRSLTDALAIQAGEILVAEEIGPSWTPLLGLVKGLVLLKGDSLSTGAIAACNYGIPCVSGVSEITTVLQTGQIIRVDGSAGIVEIIKRLNS